MTAVIIGEIIVQPLVIIGIDYDEGDQSTYRAVTAIYIRTGDGEDATLRYETGDVVADFEKAIAEAVKETTEIMLSSSADSFVMDGDGYRFNEMDMIVKANQT